MAGADFSLVWAQDCDFTDADFTDADVPATWRHCAAAGTGAYRFRTNGEQP